MVADLAEGGAAARRPRLFSVGTVQRLVRKDQEPGRDVDRAVGRAVLRRAVARAHGPGRADAGQTGEGDHVWREPGRVDLFSLSAVSRPGRRAEGEGGTRGKSERELARTETRVEQVPHSRRSERAPKSR